ncbi:MAG: sulfite exporter TauE/SafE family protein [Candidatus Komeilibacteria bacterium]|nr:sulfite exporter TauE/SafE family protein [Candidatus Komeilibacteria bacterium]
MSNFVVPIRGMHCKSCEILIEKNLKKIQGVTSVKAYQRSGKAEVEAHHQIAPELIADAVQSAGYEVGEKEKLPWFSRDTNDYLELTVIAIVLGVLFLSAKGYGLFSVSFAPSGTGLAIALLVGLVAGVSTCMALIGGLVLGVAARYAEMHPEATPAQKFRPHLIFNAGRIAGYTLLGGLIGLIGKAFQPSPNVLGILTIAVGAVMIFLGLKLIEIFPALRDKSLALPASISKFLGLHNETDTAEYSHVRAGVTGALTFFLPCGFTQAMQLYAVSTGSFASGAMIMGLFALGTAPGLLSVAGLASVLKGQAARRFFMAAGLLVIFLGSFNLVNASRLISFGSVNQDFAASDLEPQVVAMTQSERGYSPNSFTVEKGRPVKWVITSTNPYTCASSLVMRKYGIIKNLQKGQNVIEFTPTEVGTIPFSCSMGMYRGTFTVVD